MLRVAKDKVVKLIEKRVKELESQLFMLRVAKDLGNCFWQFDGGLKELKSLVLDLDTLVEVPDFVEGGLVLSPREVEVVECFARGWDDGDDRRLYGHLCYQDAFDLMGRLRVECSGVRDFGGVLEGGDEERVEGVTGSSDPVWNKGTPMPVDYTCCCGMYVHPSRRNPDGIHLEDCPYRIPIVHDKSRSSNFS